MWPLIELWSETGFVSILTAKLHAFPCGKYADGLLLTVGEVSVNGRKPAIRTERRIIKSKCFVLKQPEGVFCGIIMDAFNLIVKRH